MGSFQYTCAISGLPIGAGAKMRLLLLQSSPFSERGNYASGELSWYLRSVPVRAEYNDYGTVENVNPSDAAIQQNWLAGLEVDLLEKGWGSNTCHDVPTRKGMSFKDLLGALREERLEVRPQLETEAERRASDKQMQETMKSLREMSNKKMPGLAKGIPTIRRVERVISKAGSITYSVDAAHVVRGAGGQRYQYEPPKEEKNYSPTYDPHVGFGCGVKVEDTEDTNNEVWKLDISQLGNEDHKFIVDKLRRGEIRVRVGGYGSGSEHLLRLHGLAKKLRHHYSVMVSPGEYGHGQLLVHPKPETLDGDHYFSFHDRHATKEPKSCHLAQAMVREDVWQGLCGMRSAFYNKKYKTVRGTLDMYRKLAREAWDAYRKDCMPKLDTDDALESTRARLNSYLWKTWGHDNHNPIGYFTGDNPSISGFGMNTSWALFAQRQDLTEVEIENFLDVVAQTALVDHVVRTIRLQWRPVGSIGPQYGEWREHRCYLRKLLRIAEREVHREKIREAEQRGWSRRWKQEQEEKGKKQKNKGSKAPEEKS